MVFHFIILYLFYRWLQLTSTVTYYFKLVLLFLNVSYYSPHLQQHNVDVVQLYEIYYHEEDFRDKSSNESMI